MSLRKSIISLVIMVGFVGGILASRSTQVTSTATFTNQAVGTRPYASHSDEITTTWFCPGVPAGDPTVGGHVVVTNTTDAPIDGHITLLGTAVAPVLQAISVPARDHLLIDVDAALTSAFVAAVVELQGGEGMVEQRALYPAGQAVASCTTNSSATWFFADGWTVDGSTEQLIMTNPFAETANVDLTFFTKNGRRTPAAFQGDSIAPQSVKVISVAESGLVDEEIIGVQVTTTRGRTIVARAQHYIGGNRLGFTLTLGSPSPAEQLWFADGEGGPGITEQYVLFNPTDEIASVTATVLGIPYTQDFVSPDTIEIAAGQVVKFDMASVAGLPDGLHSMVFATLGTAPIVVERVLSRPDSGGLPITSVVMATTPEFAVQRWYVPIGVDLATDNALVVYTPDDVDATVAVKAIGPGGEVAVPGLEALALPRSGVITISLTDPSVFGRPLVVESTNRIFVERRLPRGNDLEGRSGSWALPECGLCSFSSPLP